MRLRADDESAPEAEALADELRRRAGVGDDDLPEAVAVTLGHTVERGPLPTGLRGLSVPGEQEITIRPDTPEREQLAIGHELTELHLERRPGDWEQLCQRGAAALLVPAAAFLRALLRHRLDLPALRSRFPCASMEVLGNRAVDLCEGSAFSALDPAHGYRRARNASPAEVLVAERRALASLRGASYALARADGWLAQAWRSRRRPERVLLLAVRLD